MNKCEKKITATFLILGFCTMINSLVVANGGWPMIGSSQTRPVCFIKPCSISGDFDGDGATDRAELVSRVIDEKKGILIRHFDGTSILIGAGQPFGYGGDDFSWMNHWHPVEKEKIALETERMIKIIKGDAIWVERLESSSAIIFWQDSKYIWRQLGD